jgi:hypothetical protein
MGSNGSIRVIFGKLIHCFRITALDGVTLLDIGDSPSIMDARDGTSDVFFSQNSFSSYLAHMRHILFFTVMVEVQMALFGA